MRILIINKFLYPKGGSETYIFKLGEGLKKQGNEVQYFGMEDEKNIVGNTIGVYTSNMDFHNTSGLEKIKYGLKTIYSAEARKKIRMVLEDFQPDVCHLNNFNYQLTPSIILEIVKWRKHTGKECKIIYTAHDYQLVCPDHMCNNPLTHQNCEKCLGGNFIHCAKDKCIHGSLLKSFIGTAEAYFWNMINVYKDINTIICCSDFMKSKLDTNPILAKRTVALHNFVDEIPYKEVQKKDYVLYFGRFTKEKGVETLIKVCKDIPDIQFVFAGSGPLENQLCGIDNVINVGFKRGEELNALIREAKFTICSSEWYENCPLSVMESISMGTPVLGANIGGIPELIIPGVTGQLFESGDEKELTYKVLEMYHNIKKYDCISENINFLNAQEYCNKYIEILAN